MDRFDGHDPRRGINKRRKTPHRKCPHISPSVSCKCICLEMSTIAPRGLSAGRSCMWRESFFWLGQIREDCSPFYDLTDAVAPVQEATVGILVKLDNWMKTSGLFSSVFGPLVYVANLHLDDFFFLHSLNCRMVAWPLSLWIQKYKREYIRSIWLRRGRKTNKQTNKRTNKQEKPLVIMPAVLSGGRLHGLGSCRIQLILLGSKTLGACRCPESLAARLIPASGRGQMCQSLLGLAAFSPPGS